jgi:hypothetical protein
MDRFLVPSRQLKHEKERRREQEKQQELKRAEVAARLSLPWPEPRSKSSVGRPTRQTYFRAVIYQAIRTDSLPEQLCCIDVPQWWSKGSPVFLTDAELAQRARMSAQSAAVVEDQGPFDPWAFLEPVADEASQADADFVEQVSTPQTKKRSSAEDDEESSVNKKRKKHQVSDEAKAWFLEYVECQKVRFGWGLAKCLRDAQALAPEIFGGVHVDVPRRWQVPSPKAKKTDVLPDAVLTILGEVAIAVTKELPLSARTISGVLQKEVDRLSVEYRVTEAWTREFLHTLGLSYKLGAGPAQKCSTEAEIQESRMRLKLKVAYLSALHDVPPSRVWNADETAVRLLPLHDRGWSLKGTKAHFLCDQKRLVTATLACCMDGGNMLAQLVYEGKTRAVLPMGPLPRGIEVTHSHNHWATIESLELLLKQIDREMNPQNEKQMWILVFDVAPRHVSREFKQMRSQSFPWIKFAYVDPGETGSCQPLDRTYMRVFKTAIHDSAATTFISKVHRNLSEERSFKDDLKLVTLKANLVCWVRDAMDRMESKDSYVDSAWKYIKVGDDEWEDVLEEATKRLGNGTLWTNHRGAVPEVDYADGVVADADAAGAVDESDEVAAEVEEEEGDNEVALFGEADLELLPADTDNGDELMQHECSGNLLCEPSTDVDAPSVEAPCVHAEPAAGSNAAVPSVAAGVAAAPRIDPSVARLQRLMALRLIYGRGPPRAC